MTPPKPPAAPGRTTGPIEGAPCPHCGIAMSLAGHRETGLLEQGAKIQCDRCKRWSMVQGLTHGIAVIWGGSAGQVASVRCPSCGKPEDMTALHEMQLLERGNTVACDGCGRVAPIEKVAASTLVTLTPTRPPAR